MLDSCYNAMGENRRWVGSSKNGPKNRISFMDGQLEYFHVNSKQAPLWISKLWVHLYCSLKIMDAWHPWHPLKRGPWLRYTYWVQGYLKLALFGMYIQVQILTWNSMWLRKAFMIHELSKKAPKILKMRHILINQKR